MPWDRAPEEEEDDEALAIDEGRYTMSALGLFHAERPLLPSCVHNQMHWHTRCLRCTSSVHASVYCTKNLDTCKAHRQSLVEGLFLGQGHWEIGHTSR